MANFESISMDIIDKMIFPYLSDSDFIKFTSIGRRYKVQRNRSRIIKYVMTPSKYVQFLGLTNKIHSTITKEVVYELHKKIFCRSQVYINAADETSWETIHNLFVLHRVYSLDLSNYPEDLIDAVMIEDVKNLNLQGKIVRSIEKLGNQEYLNLAGARKLDNDNMIRDIDDISFLNNVMSLDLSKTGVTDVSMLGNQFHLALAGTSVSEVSSLKSVTYLNLDDTNVTDISALGNHKNISLARTDVMDIGALENVEEIDLTGTLVVDVSMLGKQVSLKLDDTEVENVSSLGFVKNLSLSYTDVENVSSLAGVKVLNLENSLVSDISGLQSVQILNLAGTEVTDISPLQESCVLESIDLSRTKVTDISSLRNIKTLWEVDLSNTNITDVTPLKHVRTINVNHTPVKDVSCLEGVEDLKISSTEVTDLLNLRNLDALECFNTLLRNENIPEGLNFHRLAVPPTVADLRPFANVNLKVVVPIDMDEISSFQYGFSFRFDIQVWDISTWYNSKVLLVTGNYVDTTEEMLTIDVGTGTPFVFKKKWSIFECQQLTLHDRMERQTSAPREIFYKAYLDRSQLQGTSLEHFHELHFYLNDVHREITENELQNVFMPMYHVTKN